MDAVTSDDTLDRVADSGVFDLACYCEQTGQGFDLAGAISDYLLRGEREGLFPHHLFSPRHVAGQLMQLGVTTEGESVLLSYLRHADLPVSPHPLFDVHTYLAEDATVTALEGLRPAPREWRNASHSLPPV